MGKVILVGAGPGDAGLVTVKGMEKISECDVIIYDRLASDELLECTKENCIKVDVGKKPGAHTMKQEQINELLVRYGSEYESVVRLKGGDSFVFGRGGEEILALMNAGIDFELVPGVTSAVAVPEMAGIPVTHREVSRSFHVITGHTKDGNAIDESEYRAYASIKGTLVFLMGLGSLEEITEKLIFYGKSLDTPATVIENGTTAGEKKVVGNLQNIGIKVREAGLKSPVVIVVGETAAFNMVPEKKKVMHAIGTKETIERLREELKKRKAECELKTIVKMEAVASDGMKELEKLLKLEAKDYSWILFTSRQAVKMFFGAWENADIDIRGLAQFKFAVIGKGTLGKLKEYGVIADYVSDKSDAEGFAEGFTKNVYSADENGKKTGVLIPEAARSSGTLAGKISEAGFNVEELRIYDVTAKEESGINPESIRDVVLFSGSGAEAFFHNWNKSVMGMGTEKLYNVNMFVMGKTTADEVSRQMKSAKNIEIDMFVPEEQNIEKTAELIWRHYNGVC